MKTMKKAKSSAKKSIATKRHVVSATDIAVLKPQDSIVQEIASSPVPLQQAAPHIEPARVRRITPYTVFLGALVILSLGAVVYFWRAASGLKAGSQETIEDKAIAQVLEQVAGLMVLPQGETPTIATVTDLEKLRDQPFFVNAKEGYKVLIYTNARKAILYDPEHHKIVEVAPLNVGE